MNKVSLYGHSGITSVAFLIISDSNVLEDTLAGVQNASDVWEAVIPETIPVGLKTVIGISDGYVLGREIIYWNGTDVISDALQLLEVYELYGLNPLAPLSVSASQRKTGDGTTITQTITNNFGVTTVTRTPS